MSLYADYLRERTDDKIIETPAGFVVYRYVSEKTVYIVDIYIVPELRHKNLASDLANQVVAEAKERGCIELLGSVMPSAKGSTTSTKVLLAYGMALHSSQQNGIIFRKDI